jgi:cytoskeletal protein CcmA (bactofilin family)
MDTKTATQSVIAADVEITGAIKSAGSVRIDGKLEGELHCDGDAVIGKDAKIKGNLNVNSVSIEGAIQGNVTAKDRIEMKSSARVTGDIKSKRLSVEDGVTFVGRSEVNPSGTPMAIASTEPAAASSGAPAPSSVASTQPLAPLGRR